MYHTKQIEDIFKELKTDEKGLTNNAVEEKLKQYGPNEIKEGKKISPIKIFLSQFKDFLIIILLIALVISYVLGEKIDALVIGVILIINAFIGFRQEYKAEKAIEALKKLASLKSKVIRNNKIQQIDTSNLVPGDIILLETGDKIPADSRLIEVINLETQESSLTGESTPVKKNLNIYPEKTSVADQKNMVFSGTIVTKGRAKAVVTSIGMSSQIGKVASLIQEEKAKLTPLQIKMDKLGKRLGIATILIVIIVFITGVLRGESTIKMFMAAVSLAVAAIPEGLPAVVTISLALGVRRMVKRHALVRKLPSVETLGSTNVICTDKTGTLTCDQMTVRKIYTNNKVVEVTGSGYETRGAFHINNKLIDSKDFELLLRIGALCNDASLEDKKVIGDPTEAALIVSAAKAGLLKSNLEKKNPRLDEIGFDSERKRMSTLHKMQKLTMFTKGAPDVILELCDRILINGQIRRLSMPMKKEILKKNEEFAKQALRVLGFAYKETRRIEENNLIFVGLQAMIDPPRPEVKQAIDKCKKAGIKVVMITGDYKGTAVAIAKELGIEGEAITGQELSEMKNFEKRVENISIYARVNPEHKTKIVDALRKKGYVIAMTGDGVNDAPALKKSDIGIAMGITGTDVSKEASDMILTDDNFSSIVNAVEEGRGVYDNIKKFFAFMISGNVGEVMIIFLAIVFGWPLPLTATQILLINLVTDGLPAVALGADPFEPNAMKRKPRSKKEPIYKDLNHFLIYYPIIMIVVTLVLFYFTYTTTQNIIRAQTITFLSIAMFEMYQAFASRSTRFSSFKVGIFKNKWLVAAVISSLLVSIAAIYVPFLQKLFDTFPITAFEFLIVTALSSLGFIYLEIYKHLKTGKIAITED